MRYIFHSGARSEYLAATAYYEKQQEGLGGRFVATIEQTIQRILDAPKRWRKVEGEIRRCLTQSFPYGVLYTIESDHILIIAVMHLSRNPGYWRKRLP